MRQLIAIAVIAATLAATANATDNTTRRRLRVDPGTIGAPADTAAAAEDTIVLSHGEIAVSGYDKPLQSYGESFFLTNRTGRTVTAVELRIDYRDMAGRELHSRTLRHEIILEPSVTRRADISSWDKRHTFYYTRGPRPRTAGVTPYDVSITPLRAFSPRP